MDISDLKDTTRILDAALKADYGFRPDNVYREGVASNREIVGKIVDELVLPGSRVRNPEALVKLKERSLLGESCLLLLEHYNNFDYPAFFRLVEREPLLGTEFAEALLPIKGMKLSETDPSIASFSNSYDSILIYPSRSIDSVKDPAELAEVRKISVPINHAAMRELIVRKNKGRIITVFPAGTRFRSWDPESKKGVREIHSYLKIFDHVCFVAINGSILVNSRNEDMTKDQTQRNLLVYSVSDPVGGKEFRKNAIETTPEGVDPKQHIVDEVMNTLQKIHDDFEPRWRTEKEALSQD